MWVVVGEQVEVVRLWLTDWNMWLYELYDILSLNGNMALDHIFTMVHTSYDRHTYFYIILYTQFFPCNFHVCVLIFNLLVSSSKPPLSPDRGAVQIWTRHLLKTWCQSGCGGLCFRFCNGDVWWIWWRCLVSGCDGFFHKKSTASKWHLASCELKFAQLHTWVDFCGGVLQLG